jgi:hypothetical protein
LRELKEAEINNMEGSNKENLMESSSSAKGQHQRRISSARRHLSSTRKSPSPTRLDEERYASALYSSGDGGNNNHRRASNERETNMASLNARSSMTRSSEEAPAGAGTVTSRRRPLGDRLQSRSPDVQRRDTANEGEEAHRPSVPSSSLSSSQYATPGLLNGSRVLRSGHAPNKASAPWSARSIKRSGKWAFISRLSVSCLD